MAGQEPAVGRLAWAAPAVDLWRRGGQEVDAVLDRGRAATTEIWDWWEARPTLRTWLPRIFTAIVCVAYFVAFQRLVWLRHSHFGTFDYDLGMYDQGIWQLAHGRGFMTVRGMHVLGHHANVGYLLLVPFYWIGIGGPHFLNLVNTVAVVAVALPVFFLAHRHLRSSWAGFWLVAAYLFHFAPQWKIQETFHAESLAAPFFVGALYFASVRRWRAYALCVAAALVWKEDVALATAILGVAVALMFRQWRIGAITVAASAAWFLFGTFVIIRQFSPDGAVFDSLFGPLGGSASELVHTSLVHPSRLWTTIRCHGFLDGRLQTLPAPVEGVVCPDPAALAVPNPPPRGLATLMAPYGYLSVPNPQLLAVGVPQHVVNSATTADFTWDLRWHYAMFPYLGALMGSVWTAVTRRRAVVAWLMIAVMVVGVAATREKGVGPWTENGGSGWWPLTDAAVNADYRAAIRRIDGDERVTASYFLVPHLSQREHIYTFPNPWRGSNYGPGGAHTELPDQNTVDVVVVERLALNEQDRALFDAIEASGQFEVVFRRPRTDDAGRTTEVVRLDRVREGPPVTQPVVPPVTQPAEPG